MRLDVGNGLWARLMHRPAPFSLRSRPLVSRSFVPSAPIPEPNVRDSVLLSEEGKRLSRAAETAPSVVRPETGGKAAPEIETRQAEAAAKLPRERNTEVECYVRRTAATMTAMKDLAKLGQEDYLTSRDRLELDKELTRLQAETAGDSARMKLILDGRNPDNPLEAHYFEKAVAHVRKNHDMAVALLERDFKRRERGIEPGPFLDNGDGTSTATILHAGELCDSYVTEITDKTEVMAQRLKDWERRVTSDNDENHTVVVKHLTYEDFLKDYAVLSLRSVKEAERSEKLLDEKLKKLPGMAAALDDAYDRRGTIAERRAESLRRIAEAERLGLEPPDPSENPDADNMLNPDGVTRSRYNRLFKPVEDLWRIDDLWRGPRGVSFMYIVE
ncbi:hypothetical protein [uncultured Fretibacterium sp.]|uniref:hypothetical protein n=1 Tax=uncultured Fretibacterium sp. TaxID=1678694 RepID=UPI00325FDCCE